MALDGIKMKEASEKRLFFILGVWVGLTYPPDPLLLGIYEGKGVNF